jgi:hypothetical protein
LVLYCLFLGCAAAILLPIGMEQWIKTGQIGARLVLTAVACAFFAGNVPVVAVAFGLLYATGAAGLRRLGEGFAAIYALAIASAGLAWHSAVARDAGASAIFAVTASALFGVFTGWMVIRRADRASRAAAALGRQNTSAAIPPD